VLLERPADGLSLMPSADTTGITFSPQRLDFADFSVASLPLRIRVQASVLSGTYTLRFAKSEADNSKPQYLPIIPFKVTVVAAPSSAADAATQQSTLLLQRAPSVTVHPVEVDTIGYPINVLVTLSAAASNLMYLTISKQGDLNSVLAVQPRRLLIEAGTTSVYFQLTLTSPTVPPAITLNFALTSFYTVVHTLDPQSMTLQFF
jgi:hypothetical protein